MVHQKILAKLYLPARIDFIGGWSDQAYWPYEGAVINASIGWLNEKDSHYPFSLDQLGFNSCVDGFGTGLGISSILNAGHFIFNNPDKLDGYVSYSLEAEEKEGTKGGWQDQMGSIEPGFKLITTYDHKQFNIDTRNTHPILNHIMLFDTHIRRRSQNTGDQIRDLFGRKDFIASLRSIVDITKTAINFDAESFAKASIECWAVLNGFANADIESIPDSDLTWGHKLIGAGGGGYGISYVKNPEDRDVVVEMFKNKGMWATIPFLLNGPKYFWK